MADTRRVACVGRVETFPYDDEGTTIVRRTTMTELGETTGVPITVSILRSKGPGTDDRWSQPAFDLGENGGFIATPDALVRRARLMMPERFDTPLSDDELLQAAIEHDARVGIPGVSAMIVRGDDYE